MGPSPTWLNPPPSEERGGDWLAILVENYSYLLDLLVHARAYHLSRMPYEERFR